MSELPSSFTTAAAHERRRFRRIQVMLVAHVHTEEGPLHGRVMELSRRGAQLQVAGPLAVGQPIVVTRAGVELAARVMWRKGEAAGIEFVKTLDEHSYLRMR